MCLCDAVAGNDVESLSPALPLYVSFPRFYPEDFKKEGKCPAYKAVDNFDIDKYMGIW